MSTSSGCRNTVNVNVFCCTANAFRPYLMLELAQTNQLFQCTLTGGTFDVRFGGFPPQGSKTITEPTKEDNRKST